VLGPGAGVVGPVGVVLEPSGDPAHAAMNKAAIAIAGFIDILMVEGSLAAHRGPGRLDGVQQRGGGEESRRHRHLPAPVTT
jgi:hypothetical protein